MIKLQIGFGPSPDLEKGKARESGRRKAKGAKVRKLHNASQLPKDQGIA